MLEFVLYTEQELHLNTHSSVFKLVRELALQVLPFQSHTKISEPYYLFDGTNGLELWRRGDKRGVCVDARAVLARASMKSELAKACGLTTGQKPEVLDVMAGFGVDGATLALLGARVTCWERLTGIAIMAQDLLARCGAENIRVDCFDAWPVLSQIKTDVVYLDPMFELARRTALADKRIQYLEAIAGGSEYSVSQWVERALPTARQRVVVKRHIKDESCLIPDWQIISKKIRFDVYRGQAKAEHHPS